MPSRKRQKAQNNDMTAVHYGINRDTLQVETVFQTRGGRLSNGVGLTHRSGSRTAGNELVAVFNLRDIRSVPVLLYETAGERILAEWEAKAAALRTASDTFLGDKTGR